VLALACPQKLGCDRQSFWQWGGAPSFIATQVDALLSAREPSGAPTWTLDRERVYLLAWSGGASYLTDVMAQLPGRFAAVALLGGGMPSRQAGACARCPVPIYYVLGERNPLAALARSARDALQACGHPLHFETLPRADHAGEWAALRHGKLAEVLAFFAEHSLHCRE
jgi:predicted esterase